MEFRLLTHPPAAGDWNMAVDDALLSRVAAGGQPCLRFYGWEAATLSLGYFQAAKDRHGQGGIQTLPWVRRSTGGGAIVHDRELTYSLILPHPVRGDARPWYDLAHQTLIDVLAAWGIAAQLSPGQTIDPPPFLCFERRSQGDVVAAGAKIAGSAQRKHRGALLQHGSVLLETSPSAPHLTGLKELAGRRVSADELKECWVAGWSRRIGARLVADALTPQEVSAAKSLTSYRHNDPQWRNRR